MLDHEKKKKVTRLLKENSLPPELKSLGKLLFDLDDKLDEILAIIKPEQLTKKE